MTVVPLFPPKPEFTTTDCQTWGELLDDIAWQIEQGHTSSAIQRLREIADETRHLPLPDTDTSQHPTPEENA